MLIICRQLPGGIIASAVLDFINMSGDVNLVRKGRWPG